VIRVEGIAIRQGTFALEDVSFTVPSGAYGVLMGASGSGKTSILEAICGLKRPAAGSIRLGERDVTRLRPGERGIGYVPQDRALFPRMRVGDQIAFSLVVRRWPMAEIAARVEELAKLLGLEALLERTPETLSGGEAQRVALARALASRPSTLCLDEPLNALDEDTHDETCGLLADIHRLTGVTVLHVTHGLREAERLGTIFLRLRDGRVHREWTKAVGDG